jgi:superfamily II DNA helicase RecQ
MLSESEGQANKNYLLKTMEKSYFDWTTVYGEKPDDESQIKYVNSIHETAIVNQESLMEEILKNNFSSIRKLRDFQKRAIEALILDKKNVFVQNYTGSGKSLLFQLYALFNPGLTVVISPFVAITLGKIF